MSKLKVYIAGPYTQGDTAVNVRTAMQAWAELLDAGYCPYCPHWSHFQHLLTPQPRRTWLDYDLEWLKVCAAVVRLSGTSEGADGECAAAMKLGIPVFHSVAELVQSRSVNMAPSGDGVRS
jgi:hypothetical protein